MKDITLYLIGIEKVGSIDVRIAIPERNIMYLASAEEGKTFVQWESCEIRNSFCSRCKFVDATEATWFVSGRGEET